MVMPGFLAMSSVLNRLIEEYGFVQLKGQKYF